MENTINNDQFTECIKLLTEYCAEIHFVGDMKPLENESDRKHLIGFTKKCLLPKLKELLSFRCCQKRDDCMVETVHLRIELVKIYDEIMEHCPYKKEDPKYPKYREDIAILLPKFVSMSEDERIKFVVELNTMMLL